MIGCSLTTFHALPEYKRGLPDTLVTLNLHSNNLSTLAGLSLLSQLVDLNLSSNCIEIMDAGEFSTLRRLQRLNLASNNIRRVGGLSTLLQLQHLNVSHNRISSLGGLNQLTDHHVLATLDLRDNHIVDLEELTGLTTSSPTLCDVQMKTNRTTRTVRQDENFICVQSGYVAAVLKFAPNVVHIDGVTLEEAMQHEPYAAVV